MEVENLYLEVTRLCNLECEHCLRGDRENLFMSTTTIENTFNNIHKVKSLLITGGEPLLALDQIKKIIQMIKEKNIYINEVLLITNSTILNTDILNVLDELARLSYLKIKLSYDMFHYIELNRLNLLEIRQRNAELLKRLLNAHDYGDFSESLTISKDLIESKGRALKLTKERLNEINNMSNTKYVLSGNINFYYGPLRYFDIKYDNPNEKVDGTIYIDVFGNIVPSAQSYDVSDEESTKYNSNINELGLTKALINYTNYYNEIKKNNAKEARLTLQKHYKN